MWEAQFRVYRTIWRSNVLGAFVQPFNVTTSEQALSERLAQPSGRLGVNSSMASGLHRIQNLIPDVESYSWGHFVSEGFNVNTEYLVVNLLVTFGYLLPWAVLAYYLMKSREVAA